MKLHIFFVTLFLAVSAYSATPAELIQQAENDVRMIYNLGHNVGMTQDNSEGLLSALGQNHYVAESNLQEMRKLQKSAEAQRRLEDLAAEIKELARESKNLLN